MENPINIERVEEIVRSFKGSPSSIIAILQEIQEHYRYLPR
jgi:NADH:ubiquinone oxidoreductase subunit E